MKPQKLLLVVCIIAYCLLPIAHCLSQGTWTPKAPLPTAGRWAPVGFAIGTKGYIGTGYDGTTSYNDFWEYDPITNTWTQKANFGGAPRSAAAGFSIGSFGYVGTGWGIGSIAYNDFWKYDPVLNSWTQVAAIGGSPRYFAVGFSAAGKGYIGTAKNSVLLQDLWEYDPVSNIWTPKANYTGGNRQDIDKAVFVICNKAYLGTGTVAGAGFNDWWEYDPIANIWTQKTNFPGTPRWGATGFSIGSRGFLGLGSMPGTAGYAAEFWKYNPFTNSWSAITSFPGAARFDTPAFVINNRAYVGTGSAGGTYFINLWEYTPDSVIAGGNVTAAIFSSSNTICSGASVTLSASGGSTYSWSSGSTNNTIVVSPSVNTTYSVIVSDVCGSDTATVTISVINAVTAVIACKDVCAGSNATLVASGGTNYLWSNGAVTSAITVSPATTTSYSVIVSTGTCADTTNCTVNVFPAPVVSVASNPAAAGQVVTITLGQSATLTATGGGTYSWSNGATGSNITVSPTSTTQYCVTVTDANGCKGIVCVTVSIEDPCSVAGELYLPNAFSPNNDGENDLLEIFYGDMDCIKEFHLVIYNRWGEKVFETTDAGKSWDGIYNGKPQGTAVFVYYLEATLLNGGQITKKGNISLMR